MIDIDELRKTVAAKHNVLIDRDDPIFVTVTLHDLILSRYVEILTEQYGLHYKALTSLLVDHEAQAKAIGSRVISDAADYAANSIRAAVDEAISKANATTPNDGEAYKARLKEMDDRVAGAESARTIAISAAISSVIATVVVVIVMLWK